MTPRSPRRSFVFSRIAPAAVALALTFGVSGAQAAPGGNEWWELGPAGGDANALAIQPDGKIVAAGVGGDDDFMLARFTTRGARDPSFGTNGKVLTDFGGVESANAVAIQPDGEIVVAGSSDASGRGDFALARYTTSGTLDTSFGTDGKVLTDFGSGSTDLATALAIQRNGKIVVAGYTNAHGTDEFALARYTTSGTLDTSFGTGGKVVTNFGSASKDRGASVAIQPNGMIVVAGRANSAKSHKFALARYTTSGKLDKSFGTGGEVLTGFRGSKNSAAYGVALQKDEKIVAVGSTEHAKGMYFAVARYTRRGHLDPRFSGDGRLRNGWGSPSWAAADAVAIQPDGKIVAAGLSVYVNNNGSYCDGNGTSITLARYTTSGTLDKGFGKGGKVAKHFFKDNDTGPFSSCATEYANAVAIAPHRRIVTAGGWDGGYYFMLASYFSH